MSHVDEKNFAIVQFDLLVQEYMKSSHNKEVFVYLISPYFLNYRISTTWPSFTSNFYGVSDIDTFEDLLRLMRQNEISIKVLTYSPKYMKENTSIKKRHIMRQDDFIKKLYDYGCQIFSSPKVHSKLTVTSQGVLFGSANITPSAMNYDQWNIGQYFPRSMKKDYEEKLLYANEKFSDSNPLKPEDLLA